METMGTIILDYLDINICYAPHAIYQLLYLMGLFALLIIQIHESTTGNERQFFIDQVSLQK